MPPRPILDLLDGLAKRPQLYVHPVNFATVQSFLTGLSIGCRYAGIDYVPEDYHAAAEARGFDPYGSEGIVRDFRRKGLSDEEMVGALIAVTRDAYARAVARATPPTD
jgi:hypothetical protein